MTFARTDASEWRGAAIQRGWFNEGKKGEKVKGRRKIRQ